MESAAGQVPPTGESVPELLARTGRQAALIGEYRDREAAKDAVIAALQERAVAQDAKIGALDLLVADLIAKTGRDSQNSSKPPSSAGPATRADRRRAQRERRKSEPAEGPKAEKKRRGGQSGHRGGGLAFSRTPDAALVLEPDACRGCGRTWPGRYEFDPVPFDAEAARIFGRVSAAVIATGRKPRRRAIDLMIASTAIAEGLPLYTTNPDNFVGLESLVPILRVTRPAVPHERPA